MEAGTNARKIDRRAWLLFGGFASLKIAIHVLTNGHGPYGYFRDELYYLDCVGHLGGGYVDQPPLSIFILAATRFLLGDSMTAIRLPVVLAGAVAVVLAGLIVRAAGGGRFAQAVACLSVLAMPVAMTMGSFFSMNAFDQLFWALGAYLLLRLIQTDDRRLWLWFGLVAGLGLENKLSMAFFGMGLVAAMAATPLRRHFLDRRFWLGGGIAAVLFLPHVVWQAGHGWPTVEFMRNARLFKNMPTPLVKFFLGQVILVGPANAPLWIAGLLYGVFSKQRRTLAAFSILYVAVFAVFFLTNGKVYYLSPAYPMLLASGALAVERAVANRSWAKPAIVGFLGLGGLVVAPLAMPLLPVPMFLRYQQALGLRAPQEERTHSGPLPQHLGDRLGWEEFVAMTANAFGALPPEDHARCSIFVSNYGEAGAIDLFGPRFGLPRAISGHMTHYLWGPGDATGEVMLVYWDDRRGLEALFREVTEVARFHHPYVMDRQNDRPLYLCRGLTVPIAEAWKRVKAYR